MAAHNPLSDTAAWIERCVEEVLERAPKLHPETAHDCAEDMLRYWPHLPPHEAVKRYFSPMADMTRLRKLG
jgi:hypothetical protein